MGASPIPSKSPGQLINPSLASTGPDEAIKPMASHDAARGEAAPGGPNGHVLARTVNDVKEAASVGLTGLAKLEEYVPPSFMPSAVAGLGGLALPGQLATANHSVRQAARTGKSEDIVRAAVDVSGAGANAAVSTSSATYAVAHQVAVSHSKAAATRVISETAPHVLETAAGQKAPSVAAKLASTGHSAEQVTKSLAPLIESPQLREEIAQEALAAVGLTGRVLEKATPIGVLAAAPFEVVAATSVAADSNAGGLKRTFAACSATASTVSGIAAVSLLATGGADAPVAGPTMLIAGGVGMACTVAGHFVQ